MSYICYFQISFLKNCGKYFINIQLSIEKIHTCCKAFMSNFWLSIWEKNSSTDLLKLSNMLWGLFSNCLNSIGWNSSYLQYIKSQSPESQIQFITVQYPCKKGGKFNILALKHWDSNSPLKMLLLPAKMVDRDSSIMLSFLPIQALRLTLTTQHSPLLSLLLAFLSFGW